MKSISIILLTVAGSLALNAASLIGSTATVNYLFPNSTSVYGSENVTVTNGVEITCPGGEGGTGVCPAFAEPATIDIKATSITISENAGSSYTAGTFNGLQFANLNFGDGSVITAFSLVGNLPGLTAADVSFTGHSIEYNAEGLSFENAPYTETLFLTTSASAPEPATVGLFGLCIAGFGVWKFRSKVVSR